jgi:hypothetical protein
VVKSLEALDLLNDVGGLPLVELDIGDVFWAVLEDLDLEGAGKREEREEVGWKGGQKKRTWLRRSFHPCTTLNIP